MPHLLSLNNKLVAEIHASNLDDTGLIRNAGLPLLDSMRNTK